MANVIAENERTIRLAGSGVVCPLGLDGPNTWQAIRAGKSGVRLARHVDLEGLHVRIAGEVDLPSTPFVSKLLGRAVTNRKERFAFMAIEEALAEAAIDERELRRVPTGIFTGCEKEETDDLTYRRGHAHAEGEEAELRHLRFIVERYPDAIASRLVDVVGNVPVTFNYTMACSASAVAIAQAMRWLRRGVIERAIVVGADTPITMGIVNGFHMLGALSTNNDDAAHASRPFDVARDGFILAEGAGAMILETEALWKQRAGDRHAPLLRGFGMTNNKFHMTKTPPDGTEAARAMRMALQDARVSTSDIGYVNAHATSTDVGDASEARAVEAVLGREGVAVSSTKSMTGHLVAAAGIVEAIFSAFALRDGWLPPTINLDRQDDDCAIDVIANAGRSVSVRYAMSNSFGFGGTNVSIVLER